MKKSLRLLIFQRREVFLFFSFVILVGVTSFVIGVKMGQKLSYEVHGITPQDREFVHLKSWMEEDLEVDAKDDEDLEAKSQETLKKKFEQIAKMEEKGKKQMVTPPLHRVKKAGGLEARKDGEEKQQGEEGSSFFQVLSGGEHKGKWIIQLGSYRDLDHAQRFANGFKVRGYRPIINKIILEERGAWYRVGLGIFNNVSEVKDFIAQEKSLFQGQDYTIVQLH